MRHSVISIILLLPIFLYGQIDSFGYDEKAMFLNGDVENFVVSNMNYPLSSLASNESGTVLLSCIITKEGQIDSILPISYPSKTLVAISISTLEMTANQWSPTIKDGKPIDFTYMVAINFQIFKNRKPINYNEKAAKYIKKKKYKKAIKVYTKAIKKNPYVYSNYGKRSGLHSRLGDEESAIKDYEKLQELYHAYLFSAKINAVGMTRSRTVTSEMIRKY